MLVGALAALALLRASALEFERPKGARRRAMERAHARARARLAVEIAAVAPAAEAAAPVFCPEKVESETLSAEAVCQPSTRPHAVSALIDEFHVNFAHKVGEVVGKSWVGSYLTIGSWRSGPFLGNWLAHAKKVTDAETQGHMHVVNVALDQGAMDGCENFRNSLPDGRFTLSCVSLAGWLPPSLFSAHQGVEDRIGSCESNLVLWTKPVILKAAVEASTHPVLLVDTDVIVYKDMMTLGASLLNTGTKELVVGVEGNGMVNTGTVFATKASLPLLKAWVDKDNKCLNGRETDKSSLQHVLHYHGKQETLGTFPLSEVGQCEKKGWYATHYNCAGKKKAVIMRGMQNWVQYISMNATEVMRPGQHFSFGPGEAERKA